MVTPLIVTQLAAGHRSEPAMDWSVVLALTNRG
jgi:hypothetical protein